MPSSPSFVICIPVWDDYVRLLPEAVASLVGQMDERWEIVVVDNASQQPIPESAEYRVIRVVRRLSIGGVRNWAIRHLDAEHLMFWDADDQLLAGTLTRLESGITSDPTASAAVCSWRGWNAETGEELDWRFPKPWASLLSRWRSGFAAAEVLLSLFPSTGATLFRARLLRDIEPCLDVSYGEDWSLALALALRGRILFVNHPGRLYRVHGQSLTSAAATQVLLYGEVARALRTAAIEDVRSPWWMPMVTRVAKGFHRYKLWVVSRASDDEYHRLAGG